MLLQSRLLTVSSSLYYDAEVVENEEEECDTDLERQNVEELYDYVRHQHQKENQDVTYDVQHKVLIPVLRPYQSQAVNWMLRREKYNISTPKGTYDGDDGERYACPFQGNLGIQTVFLDFECL